MHFGIDMDCTWCYFGYMHPCYIVDKLCIMVCIHIDAHEYIFFSKFEYFMYFLVDRFCFWCRLIR
jgi:hypothetical protein